jgi:integrase
LHSASPRLQRLIIAALETGCRLGELLALHWGDVDLERKELTIRAEHAKDDESRTLPLSARLRAAIEMSRHDAAGQELPASAHVFGDEIGTRSSSSRRRGRRPS